MLGRGGTCLKEDRTFQKLFEMRIATTSQRKAKFGRLTGIFINVAGRSMIKGSYQVAKKPIGGFDKGTSTLRTIFSWWRL